MKSRSWLVLHTDNFISFWGALDFRTWKFYQNVSVKNSEAEPISDKFQLEMNKLLDLH